MFSHTRTQLHSSTPSATHLHASSAAARTHKPSRKPGFRVFCDDDAALDPAPSAGPARPRTLKPSTAPQTVVNNKENQVPELDCRTIARHSARSSSARTRVLGEKAPAPRVNCVDKWGAAIIPFAPCGPAPAKFSLLEPIKTANHPPRRAHSRTVNEPPKKTKPAPAKRLSAHVYRRAAEEAPSQPATHAQPVDDGLVELVSKLEALQAAADPPLDILEPLPPNATCPGAPKIPGAFTMPLFVADDNDCEEDDCDAGPCDEPHCDAGQIFVLKSPSSHHMSPLAEVTEAFTGLQGGWSPPLETRSPVMQDPLSDPISFPTDLS